MSGITQFPIPETRQHWRSYLPEFLLRRLSTTPTLAAPDSRDLEAVLLLSDIRGFSGLVQKAVESGRGGLESLSAQLNAYFALLAEVVLDEGGDVLSVAGDAFLCLFEAEAGEDSLTGAARRAARAGTRIQQRLREGGMPTRIGVAAGAVAVGQVGGHDERWDLVLGGPALEQVVAAERACPVGEVLVCSRTRELLGAGAVFAPASEAGQGRLVAAGDDTAPRRRAPAPDIDAERLRPYVPAIVLQRELLTDKAWMAEFRYVSVLLAQLPPLLPSDGESLAQLHAGVGAFQRVISRYQGTMKVDADDKGLLLLGVFGLPMRSHEDNAGRAVRCAIELVEGLRAAGLPTAVAVTTGRAFCGVFGNHLRREYMLRGDVINLAARLSKSREDEVLCDRATVHGAREAAHFEAVGEVAVRGVPQPVSVWRAVAPAGPASAPARPLALVGREAERAVLGQALDDVAAGRSGMALISAEAGLGKSRLIAELRHQARERRVTVLLGQAASIERSTPYFAWRPVVQRLLGLAEDTPRAGWPARLRERLGDTAPLLGDLLDVAIEDNSHTAQLRGEVRAGNTRAAAMQLLQAAAREGPTLLVMEDLHWFDSSSLALLLELAQALVQAGLPLLLVATSRQSPDTQADAAWSELRTHCQALDPERVLELPVLGEDDMRALMAQRLGVIELPPTLEDFVLARVGGHPYFCEEFLLALRECGALRVEGGRCKVGELESMDLPTTVEGTLVSRIDGLTEPEQLCLKISAVVGRRFAERTVTEAHPLESERTQVGERLRSLCRSELTQPEVPAEGVTEDSGAEHRFRFKHQITRDVAYDMMSSAQRRSLHAGVAQALELVHVLDASPPHAVLAYHWDCASEPTRALHHLERAGEQALRGGAFFEAQAFFQRAVDSGERSAVAAEPGRVAQWLKGLGTAQYFLGDMASAQRNLERAVGTIDRPVPTSAAAGGASLRELAVQALHALAPSRFHGREAARQAVLDNAVDIYRTLGQIYYLDGDDMGRVTYVTLRGVNVGQRAGPSQALARVLANAGSMMGWLGLNRWSDAYLDAAVRMAGQGGQSGAEAYVWNITALTQAQRGAWVPALGANQRALELVRKIGDHNLEAEVWIVRATVHDCAGDYTELAADWPRARELALQRRNPQILCWSYLDECDALLGADDTAGAARALELALATPTAPNDGSSVADKAQARAVVRLRQGRLGEALEAAREVLALVTRQPPSGYHWVHFLAVATEVLIELARAPGAKDAALAADAARGVRALEKLSGRFRNVLPRSRWLRGQLLQGAAARPRYAEALRLAEQNDMSFERARALVALASLPDASAEERRRAQAEALPCFARLGAVHELRRWAGVIGPASA